MQNLSRHHIKYVLGIDIPLNESYQLNEFQYKQIIEAQLLYESFLDTIKNAVNDKVGKFKEWKDTLVAMIGILSNKQKLNNFSTLYWKRFRTNTKDLLINALNKLGLSKLAEKFENLVDKITSLQGWQKFMAATAVGSIVTFVLDNIKNFPSDQLKDYVSSYLTDNALSDILAKLTDIQSYLGWLSPIIKSAKVFYDSIKKILGSSFKAFQMSNADYINSLKSKPTLEECCSRSIALHETYNRLLISEGLNYHIQNKIDLNESIYRPQSAKFLELFEEARMLYEGGKLQLSEQDSWYFDNTELGKWGEYNGVRVPLDFPMTIEFLLEVKKKAKKQPELNKPKRGGSKKFYVYVRKPGGGIKKVSFGDTSGLSAKINNPEARRSFAARHKCSQAKDKTTPKYWSCRLPRYAKLLGLKSNFSGFW